MGPMMPGPGPGALWPVLMIVLVAVMAFASLWLLYTTGHRGGGRDKLPARGSGAAEAGSLAADLRASDADREQAVAALQEHTATGRITLAELDERLTAVYAARTLGDLRKVLADLPGR